jgi:hypothetical protein
MKDGDRRWRHRVACICVCLAAAAAGCGDSSPIILDAGGDDLAQDATESDGAAPDGTETLDGDVDATPLACPLPDGGAGASCNELVTSGPCVGQIQVDDNAPAPHGGELAAGTYDLTERILYTNPGGATGPTGEPLVETLALRGAGASWTLDRAGFTPAAATRTSASASVSGVTIRLALTCPTGSDPPTDAGSSDGGPPTGPGELVYYTSADSGSTLVLYRFGPTGPVRADTYVRR